MKPWNEFDEKCAFTKNTFEKEEKVPQTDRQTDRKTDRQKQTA